MATAQAAENHGVDEAWPDIYNVGYMHQFQPEFTPMEHLSNDRKDHHENSHQLCDETEHPVLS